MANPPSPPWWLNCPWCSYKLLVNARGQRGKDPGAGVDAALHMQRHAEAHGRTWREYLDAKQENA